MPITRRQMLLSTATTLAAVPTLADLASTAPSSFRNPQSAIPNVETPNGSTLPHQLINGVKVLHLTASVFQHEFAPGLRATCWGYNHSTPGPTIEATEGDHLRIFVTNNLPEPTTVHWHGLILPNGMDGVTGLTQEPILPGQTFKYEFTLRQHGTFMYHPHLDDMTQQALGMMGMFIIHPKSPTEPPPDRDFAIMLSEWRIDPGSSVPSPLEMTDFNVLTMNSKCYPATAPLILSQGQRVRIRFGNLSSMEHHPIHLHGHTFQISQSDGGNLPPHLRPSANTVLVPVGTTCAIDFLADNPGDWPMHCHMTHHAMNQMGHHSPNLLGVHPTTQQLSNLKKSFPGLMLMGNNGMEDMMEMSMPSPKNSIPMQGQPNGPFGLIDMGGMFTLLKIRPNLTPPYPDPGYYQHPPQTQASLATPEDLRINQISLSVPSRQKILSS
jgi:FtsP/CotA-like multicopper oxidase with cupredoxin domain